MNTYIPVECATVLYKYKDLSGDGITHVEDMLRHHRIWFSSPLEFNDPFDCRCVWDIRNSRDQIVVRIATFLAKTKGLTLPDAVAEADAEIPRSSEELDEFQERQIKGISQRAANTGILCCSAACENPIMWAHYANSHTGICIEFRFRSTDEESHVNFIAEAQRIDYSDRCPLINFIRDDQFEIVRKAFLTKATPYSYELEWRIVRYGDGPGLKPIPEGIIGAVILGVQIDDGMRNRVIRACAEYDGDVEVVRASLDPHSYGLRFELEQTV